MIQQAAGLNGRVAERNLLVAHALHVATPDRDGALELVEPLKAVLGQRRNPRDKSSRGAATDEGASRGLPALDLAISVGTLSHSGGLAAPAVSDVTREPCRES
jgi:hypothetical protein